MVNSITSHVSFLAELDEFFCTSNLEVEFNTDEEEGVELSNDTGM
ncbi:hypothetical protein PC129_g24080 [Phytophthora cactorum]|uniref:Uncharacterized protein n=1 Tax=Phytophthora cactorum TaxID=29920 RepID=A0A329R8H0_9STRA|nr:hypothetical protein Pcac1_g1252 [Phytophthora cactorum]KAG2791254.1 hypothetical protein PC112_g24317 [Phytophthora cactorum]KAG2792659.1 hypothetical protein PC111_g23365 [Phytophthora cactorum]KAG2806089.1 hypothetical protein PC113_g24167 [Phytophthora cactorum]KAG2870942.1 hypothetical protein PC114_g27150 [Phytophthora cactorum]